MGTAIKKKQRELSIPKDHHHEVWQSISGEGRDLREEESVRRKAFEISYAFLSNRGLRAGGDVIVVGKGMRAGSSLSRRGNEAWQCSLYGGKALRAGKGRRGMGNNPFTFSAVQGKWGENCQGDREGSGRDAVTMNYERGPTLQKYGVKILDDTVFRGEDLPKEGWKRSRVCQRSKKRKESKVGEEISRFRTNGRLSYFYLNDSRTGSGKKIDRAREIENLFLDRNQRKLGWNRGKTGEECPKGEGTPTSAIKKKGTAAVKVQGEAY